MAEPFQSTLSTILVDPVTHGQLLQESNRLIAKDRSTDYPIEDGIPIMLTADSRSDHQVHHYTTDASAFDYFEDRHADTAHDEHRLHQTILRTIDKSARSVLDVGCGNAWLAAALCPQGVEVCSLDASITNPHRARTLYPFHQHAAVVADAMHLPFCEESFDCVVASEIIEHMPDPRLFLIEIFRVLKPGGKLIVSTPYKEKIRYSLCVHCNQPTPLNAHLHSFDENSLSALSPPLSKDYAWQIFGNKALVMLQTHILFWHLPYLIWRVIDSIANLIINKRYHIVVQWKREENR